VKDGFLHQSLSSKQTLTSTKQSAKYTIIYLSKKIQGLFGHSYFIKLNIFITQNEAGWPWYLFSNGTRYGTCKVAARLVVIRAATVARYTLMLFRVSRHLYPSKRDYFLRTI